MRQAEPGAHETGTIERDEAECQQAVWESGGGGQNSLSSQQFLTCCPENMACSDNKEASEIL